MPNHPATVIQLYNRYALKTYLRLVTGNTYELCGTWEFVSIIDGVSKSVAINLEGDQTLNYRRETILH